MLEKLIEATRVLELSKIRVDQKRRAYCFDPDKITRKDFETSLAECAKASKARNKAERELLEKIVVQVLSEL